MGDQHCKRNAETNAETVSVTEESSSSSSSSSCSGVLSKRRRRITTTCLGGCQFQLSPSVIDLHDRHLSELSQDEVPAGSPVDSINSGDGCSVSCCSRNEEANEVVVNVRSAVLDLEAKGFRVTNSTYTKIKWFSKLSEFSGDSEEMEPPPALGCGQKILPTAKMPSEEEMEEFFSVAEKSEQKRFAEKYNYDVVKDVPLEGPYQWVRL